MYAAVDHGYYYIIIIILIMGLVSCPLHTMTVNWRDSWTDRRGKIRAGRDCTDGVG